MASHIKELASELPVLPLRDTVVFPRLITPLAVGREQSKESVRVCSKDNTLILLVAQRDPAVDDPAAEDLYRIGVACHLLQVASLPDGSLKVLVEGIERVRVRRYLWRGTCRKARVEQLPDLDGEEEGAATELEQEAIARAVTERFNRYALLNSDVPEGAVNAVMSMTKGSQTADIVAAHLSVRADVKQKLLEMIEPPKRLRKLTEVLEREIAILEVQRSIDSQVRDRVQKTQREYFLREQLSVIREELDGDDGRGISTLEKQIKDAGMPDYAEAAALRELDRLGKTQLHSPQASVSIEYIETLIGLPWNAKTDDDLDLARAEKVLNKDHYGLEEVKDRVLDYLAVRKLAPGQKGQILCFIGPPGVGKTSIARSIAEALGRKFVKKSLGGVRDEAEIRGHRRTYVAAMPGGIIKGMSKVAVKNPVFLLDEIDKLSRDFHGDPGAALLEVLDPAENRAFADHFVEVEFDLSEVFFITTGNWLENIPPVLRDRMEVIRFSGYTPTEKVEIARRHLIPDLLKEHGIAPGAFSVSKATVQDMILSYTREAGVRELKRKLATLCRKMARKLAQCTEPAVGRKPKKTIAIRPADLQSYLGPPPYFKDSLHRAGPGAATGLAWTETGGKVMSIEVSFVPGKGKLTLTGSLGDVMKESAKAAVTFVQSNAKSLKIDCGQGKDIHIHVPEGATPKDGPSAGVALLAALLSAYKGTPVDPKIALTGEITLRGRVLPIGGLKEKLLAAHREGVKKVIMPESNRADLKRVPDEILGSLEIAMVANASQAISECGLQ